jgi:enediyne biosynthesis protein E4
LPAGFQAYPFTLYDLPVILFMIKWVNGLTGIIAVLCLFTGCRQQLKKQFTLIPPSQSGIHFSNRITENDSVNILDNEYVYNGGGVAIADFNNDGLQDVYFTGNMVGNKMYLNRGGFRFEDITAISKTNGGGRWCSGVAIVDINQDKMPDIYVCATFTAGSLTRQNLLYVNQGTGKNGIPVFKEMAAEYGIADTSHSTNAVFFDYDRDGDLDLYVLVDRSDPEKFPNKYHHKITDGSSQGTDRLYRNDWNDSLKHPVFTNVSKQAGILIEGFGLGVHISDINRDGWPDIYVTNDYITNDLLYINNKNGTFTNRAPEYFKHTSFSAMGNDIVDINNDGLQDIIALDMLPEDNFRKKMMLNPNNYSSYLNTREFNYEYQYVRNTLQLNLGNRPDNDTAGHPIFGDIAYFAGISSTDWSWAPLVADFDNDGYRDIIITNGFPKDVTDHDFIAYRDNTKNLAPKEYLLEAIPAVKLRNYAFRNNQDLTFSNVTGDWGIEIPTFSSGAAIADLDNDGDLDYIVNNTNDSAHIFRNNLVEKKTIGANYLRILLQGDKFNNEALGAFVELSYGMNKKQVYEQTPFRGYLSTFEPFMHFGLGADTLVSEIKITWPDGKKQILKDVRANQVVTIVKSETELYAEREILNTKPFFEDITTSFGINYVHREKDYIDFNVQRLLPHKFSQNGPAIAIADLNGDKLDDVFLGGSYGYSAKLFFQQTQGGFLEKDLYPGADFKNKQQEDAGVLLFDADGDGDIDIYIASGGYENEEGSENYKDRFYLNDGHGNFSLNNSAFPNPLISKGCVKAADFDRDGDLDLFVGGRLLRGKYPMPVSSFIFRNDSKGGIARFTDITSELAPGLINIGLVCDMLWTDYDNDGWLDIMLAGEWMPLTFLKNESGNRFSKKPIQLKNSTGWWNSLTAGDFDNDGDMDYMAGNVGLNSFYKANEKYPVRIYADDYNNDGGYDAIPTLFLPDKNGKPGEFPAFGRDDMIKQMIGFKKRFTNYQKYALSPISEILTAGELKKSLKLEAVTLATSYIKNIGGGRFEIKELPVQAQLSSVFAMSPGDVNGDNNLDLVITGNDYGTEISTGRYDAMSGLVLRGDGKGNFTALSASESGLFIPGDGKALALIKSAQANAVLLATQNQGALLAFSRSGQSKILHLLPDDVSAEIFFKNDSRRKQEFYYGNSFYSQSGRYLLYEQNAARLIITNSRGKKREIAL